VSPPSFGWAYSIYWRGSGVTETIVYIIYVIGGRHISLLIEMDFDSPVTNNLKTAKSSLNLWCRLGKFRIGGSPGAEA